MRMKVLAIFAVVALVAACETAPEEQAATTGTGAAAGGAGGTASAAPAKPTGPAPGTQEDLVVNVGDRVYFDFDKYNLKPEARTTLEAQAAWLKKFPALTITVEGHCDERGTREYNLGLGERRANAVKDYLTALGVAPSRVKTISYGEERPVALGSTNAAWALNRRGVTVITGGAGS
jgi:peptidoglycan-associated lipoprotein